jgi:hypothetical protein
MIIFIQLFEITINLLMDLLKQARARFLTEITFFAVDGLDFAAIDSDQRLSKYITFLASEGKFSTDLLQGLRRSFVKISNRVERWSEPVQPPHQFDMAMRLVLSLTAGTNLVQIAMDVQLQPSTRLIGRPTCFLGSGILKTQRRQIQALDIDIDDTNGVGIVNVVVDNVWEKPDLIAVTPIDIAQSASPKTRCVCVL